MYLANLDDSLRRNWIAISADKDGAIALLRKTWEHYAQELELEVSWDFVEHDVYVRFTREGDVWVDGDLMHAYDTARGFTNG